MRHFFIVDPAGNPTLRGADLLNEDDSYRMHAFAGGGLRTEAQFRNWAANLARGIGGRADIDQASIPAADAPIEALVAHCNRVGWRVFELLGENVYHAPAREAVTAAAQFWANTR